MTVGWTRGVAVFMAIACFGIIIAAIVFQLNTMGVVVDELVTASMTIEDIMSFIVLVFMILGGVLAVATS